MMIKNTFSHIKVKDHLINQEDLFMVIVNMTKCKK